MSGESIESSPPPQGSTDQTVDTLCYVEFLHAVSDHLKKRYRIVVRVAPCPGRRCSQGVHIGPEAETTRVSSWGQWVLLVVFGSCSFDCNE